MSAPNGGKVEGNFTAQELDSIMKNHENKFMKVSYYVIFSKSQLVLKFNKKNHGPNEIASRLIQPIRNEKIP